MTTDDFLDTNDFTPRELGDILSLVRVLKDADRDGCVPALLQRRSLGMIFEEPSTRTRVSFEVAMAKLGGHALYLRPGEIHLGVRESIADTARVLSTMCDVIEARVVKHDTLVQLAAASTVPVINGLSDYNHPTQALCDLFTMMEHLPPGKTLEDCTIVFVGDRTNVCSSLMHAASSFGMSFVHAGPANYLAPPEWVEIARRNQADAGHGTTTVTTDVEDAVAEADFVYTDTWWWIGQEAEVPARRAAFMPRYQVTTGLMDRAPATARFKHCLPASRGVEVTDEVIDSERSIVFAQAENRLHVEKALLVWFTYARVPHDPPAELAAHHAAAIQAYLAEHQGEFVGAHRTG